MPEDFVHVSCIVCDVSTRQMQRCTIRMLAVLGLNPCCLPCFAKISRKYCLMEEIRQTTFCKQKKKLSINWLHYFSHQTLNCWFQPMFKKIWQYSPKLDHFFRGWKWKEKLIWVATTTNSRDRTVFLFFPNEARPVRTSDQRLQKLLWSCRISPSVASESSHVPSWWLGAKFQLFFQRWWYGMLGKLKVLSLSHDNPKQKEQECDWTFSPFQKGPLLIFFWKMLLLQQNDKDML